MDNWCSLLSKTNLHPSLVYEYSFVFSQNQLEEDDLPYFNHEFLQSMGIEIAKHRLEILKLMSRGKRCNKFPTTIKCYLKRLMNCSNDSVRCYSPIRRSNSRLKRSKVGRSVSSRMIAYDNPLKFSTSSRMESFPIPRYGYYDDYLPGIGTGTDEQIRWDSMFQNLKPT